MEVAKQKLELEQTRILQNKIEAAHKRLENIRKEFDEHDKAYKSFKDNERMGIENSLTKFEILFKEYLMSYEYKSNYRSQIYFELNRASSYLYFPLVQMQYDSSEQLRSVSSASDFIRSIWAYYLALLKVGSKHPGFVIFDEPCQQSMDESSLKKLFECSSKFMDRQVIFFCSSQPHTAENNDGGNGNIIEDIIQNMPNKAMINAIEFKDRAIDLI